MRNRSFEEFESLFERASIPVFNLPRVTPGVISCVLSGTSLDTSLLSLAEWLTDKFDSKCLVCWPFGIDEDRTLSLVRKHKLTAHGAFSDFTELSAQLNKLGVQLAITGADVAGFESERGLDDLVFGCSAPVLIIRNPVEDPGKLFSKLLHCLTGDLKQIRNLAYSFSLVSQSGSLTLMHTVDETEIEDLGETLKVSPDVSTASGEKLIHDLSNHAERYLKGMVAASHDESYTVNYRLAVGDVLDAIEFELAEGSYTLLVVGTHEDTHSNIDAEEYKLMHLIRELPVLAL